MNLQQLNILINDTFVAATLLNIERTENANPVLKYNGSDDEYQPIMASELTFNMLVPDAADGKFLHLFTGNETRYQVQLENKLTGDILWTGFLLPDFYSEPYENGCFFVSFTATDGLARLKNKFLPDDFYKDQKTLPQVITACLKLTGSYFNTAIAPAINNAVVDLKQYEILVPTNLYIKKDKKQNAYEILEDLITVMGCRLFLWGDMWYIIGINRYNDLTVNVEFYGTDGTGYISDGITSFTRSENTVMFEAHPSISAMPPFKEVIIDWQKDERANVFPLDVVFQKDEDFNAALSPGVIGLDLKYWEQTGTGFYKMLNYDTIAPEAAVKSASGPYYLNIIGTVSGVDIEYQHLTLATEVNILGSSDYGEAVDFEISAVIWCDSDPTTNVNFGSYARMLLYDLTKDGVTIASNKTSFSASNIYDYEFKVGEVEVFDYVSYWPINCTLKIEGLLIGTDGRLNIKLHPIIAFAGMPYATRVAYTKLSATYSTKQITGTLKKSRNIDFTTNKEVSTVWGFDKSDLTENKLIISPFVHMPATDFDVAPQMYTINIENFFDFEGNYFGSPFGAFFYPTYSIGITQKNYLLLKAYPDKLYVKHAATNLLTKIISYTIVVFPNNAAGYVLHIFDKPFTMTAADDLILDIPAETITITDDRYLIGAWTRVGETENIDYNEALARIYHSTVGEVKFKIEGNVFELVNPLEFFQFDYFAPRNYNATSLTMNLSEGMTTVVFIESVNAIIEDYGEAFDPVFIEDIEV